MRFVVLALAILVLALPCPTSTLAADLGGLEEPEKLAADESVLFVAGTNDIHGGFETSDRNGKKQGGFAWFAGTIAALRGHVDKQYGDKGSVILLDGGDAAQGTLLSNYDEGSLAVKMMNAVGYTAAVPGNHAYDFGPEGWKVDVVPEGGTGDPLGAFKKLVKASSFPFLGANVTTTDGKPMKELPPFTLAELPGRRKVAIIGLENPMTPVTTVAENVASMKFSPGVDEVKQLVDELRGAGKADVFVLVMHEGDSDKAFGMGDFLQKLPKRADGQPLLDAVIAGHSHFTNDREQNGIPYVQSGANGRMFGVIRLVLKAGKDGKLAVVRTRTKKKGGIPIMPKAGTFLGEKVAADAKVAKMLAAARKAVAPIADRHLCTCPDDVSYDGGRTADSEMGNLLADMMLKAGGTDIAVINSGDVRSGMLKGDITYESLFSAVPKNVVMCTITKTPVALLAKNMERSIRSCGRRGALQFAGITVEFKRDCTKPVEGEDRNAELVRIKTTDGKTIYEKKGDKETISKTPISMVTSDFMMTGGAGYKHFQGLPIDKQVPLRDAVADELEKVGKLDPKSYAVGRYKNLLGN